MHKVVQLSEKHLTLHLRSVIVVGKTQGILRPSEQMSQFADQQKL
jgi:hypothetical protein